MEEKTIKYKGEGVTVIWKPRLCIHSGICWRGLPKVFNPKMRKWIIPDAAPAETVKQQVEKCPTAALTYEGQPNAEKKPRPDHEPSTTVTILPNGPMMIEGDITLVQGDSKEQKDKICLCRCGQTRNKPYCDGSHLEAKFRG